MQLCGTFIIAFLQFFVKIYFGEIQNTVGAIHKSPSTKKRAIRESPLQRLIDFSTKKRSREFFSHSYAFFYIV